MAEGLEEGGGEEEKEQGSGDVAKGYW